MSNILTQRALEVLLENPCPIKEFIGKVVGSDRANYAKSELTALSVRLKRTDLIRVFGGKYYITEAGRSVLEPEGQVKGNIISKMDGNYHCPELGRTCQREGAYDFLDIPSVFGPERRPYTFKSGVN